MQRWVCLQYLHRAKDVRCRARRALQEILDSDGMSIQDLKKIVYPKHNSWHGHRETTECCPTLVYDEDQLEFMNSMRKYQIDHNRRFPAWSEVLGVVKSLGYRKEKVTP